MLNGPSIHLRQVREQDLDFMYQIHTEIENRGPYFPVGVASEPEFRKRFRDTGYWGKDAGMLLITSPDGDVLGHIEFFHTVAYLDEIELSYHLYSPNQAGKGVATEAVRLLTEYLFDWLKINRIRLIIDPGNRASQRVAQKNGYTHEGTARGAWFHRGRNRDVEVYALLRNDKRGDDNS